MHIRVRFQGAPVVHPPGLDESGPRPVAAAARVPSRFLYKISDPTSVWVGG